MDKYDKAVKYYKKYPEKIKVEWDENIRVQHGVLFKRLGSTFECGCISQIKTRKYVSKYLSITEGIMKDKKIPIYDFAGRFPLKQFMKSLNRFAYWNRKYDELENNLRSNLL